MKIEFKKRTAPSFKRIEIEEPTVQDIARAEMLTGRTEGIDFIVALISQIATFDGRKIEYEELRNYPLSFFSQIISSVSEELTQVFQSQPLSSVSEPTPPSRASSE